MVLWLNLFLPHAKFRYYYQFELSTQVSFDNAILSSKTFDVDKAFPI